MDHFCKIGWKKFDSWRAESKRKTLQRTGTRAWEISWMWPRSARKLTKGNTDVEGRYQSLDWQRVYNQILVWTQVWAGKENDRQKLWNSWRLWLCGIDNKTSKFVLDVSLLSIITSMDLLSFSSGYSQSWKWHSAGQPTAVLGNIY